MKQHLQPASPWITPALEPQAGTVEPAGRPDHHPTWWMRRSLMLDKLPETVTLSVVCLGYYEIYVNGERLGDEPLAPSLTRLDRRGLSVTHDLTAHLQPGDNVMAIWCSSGWYLPHQFAVHEGWSPLLRLQLHSCTAGEAGHTRDLTDAPWWCRASNRTVLGTWSWNDFGGEEVDARNALPDWNRVGCPAEEWHPARVVSPPPIEIDERSCPPSRIGEVYPARAVRKLDARRFEVDFGTCLSGWVDIQFGRLDPGQTVTLRFYDLPADNDRTKDQSYNQRSIYRACGDGMDRFENKFNYAGFRYLTLEGLEAPPPLEKMRALLVESAMARTGAFRCSNPLFNRIHDLNVHTLRCLNLGGYSVDCPHRERMGYGADAQTALPAYLYAMDCFSFLRKWLVDWGDVYEPDTGRISLCAPNIHQQHAPAWGGIVAPLAWQLYLFYGDRESMARAFPVIQGHLRFLQKAVQDGVLRKARLGSAFHGDWVAPRRGMDSANTPDLPMRELFNSCYLIYLWQLYLKICQVLGRSEETGEAEANMAVLREGVHREFYNEEAGLYLVPEQAYQAMPLLTGVVPKHLKAAIQDKLVGLIKAQDGHLDTGVSGTPLLLEVLADADEHELISRIYNQETYPGWGYMLARGATTIWEQWNGFWSQIHSCFAGPAAWFYSGLAGIRPDEAHPGSASFVLAPAFVPGIDFVEAHYDSVRGRIESVWRREPGSLIWNVTIPEGTVATVCLPLAVPGSLTVNGHPPATDVQHGKNAKGRSQATFHLAGGRHELQWPE